MADLYVLEGRGKGVSAHARHRGNRHVTRTRRVPGIVYGDPLQTLYGRRPVSVPELLGRSLWAKAKSIGKSVAKVAVAPVTTTYSVAKSATKAATHAVLNPSVSNLSKVVTNPLTRGANETKSNVKEVAHAAAETGRFVNTAASRSLNVINRVAKRLIKKVAKAVLFHGDSLLGSGVAAVPKNAAKAILIPAATAAVLANTVTAPAAPAVPVLVNEVINELYSSISDAVSKGLSPEDAAKAAQDKLDQLEPGEENDPKVSYGSFMPVAIGLAAVVGLVVILKKRRS